MGYLMTISEMIDRYNGKEDPFDLTIEKWKRIRQSADAASNLKNFQELFQAANVAVPFCFLYQSQDCEGCPLADVCARGKQGRLLKVMKLIQLQILAILAGNLTPKEPLRSEIDGLLNDLESAKSASQEHH